MGWVFCLRFYNKELTTKTPTPNKALLPKNLDRLFDARLEMPAMYNNR